MITAIAIDFRKGLFYLLLVLSLSITSGFNPVLAGEDPGDLFNYSFAVWLGSGVYKVSDADKRFAVLRIPAAYTLRDIQDDKPDLVDRLGFRLLLPAVIGFQDETETDFRYGTAAFVPGLEVQVPINPYWTLKPFAQAGGGKDTAGGTFKYVYGAGLRSLVSIPWKKFVFGIGNSWVVAKDRDSTSTDTTGFSLFNAGIDIRFPTNLILFDQAIDMSCYFVVNWFRNDVDLLSDEGETSQINTLYDIGLTFGVKEPVSIWLVSFDRVGIDYRFGDEGFSGIGFNLGFPF